MDPKLLKRLNQLDKFLNDNSDSEQEPNKPTQNYKPTLDDKYKKTDNIFITALIAFIASFFKLSDLNNFPTRKNFSYYFSVFAFCFFILSFFMLIWRRYRYSLKLKIWTKKYNKWRDKSINTIFEFIDLTTELTSLKIKTYIYENHDFLKSKSNEEIDLLIKKNVSPKKIKIKMHNIVELVSKSLSSTFSRYYQTSFTKPLNENFSKLKFFIDILSENWRYKFILIGVVFYLIALFI